MIHLPNPFSPAALRAARLLGTLADLEAKGCRILDARANAERAVIRIAPPPPGLFASWGYVPPPPLTVRVPVLCATHYRRTRVEWISKETRR